MNALTIRGLALALALSVSGCAAIRVDVDVYKGPLANHKDVQVQQYAAMAIGSKPLLAYLRDMYQERDWAKSKADAARSEKWRQACRVGDGFFGEPNDELCKLTNPNAKRVNAVLSLYEDRRADPHVEPYARRAKALRDEYESALHKLRENSGDQALRKRVTGDMLTSKEGITKALGQKQIPAKQFEQLTKFFKELKKGYEELVSPGSGEQRDSRKIFDACNKIRAVKVVGAALLCSKDSSANARFDALADKKTVASHMKLLFGTGDGQSALALAAKAREAGQAFADGRSALLGLWRLSLQAILDLHAKTSPEMLKLREILLPDLAEAASTLTQPSLLACALDPTSVNTPVPPEVRTLLDISGGAITWIQSKKWDEARYARAAGALERALLNEPRRTAEVLLEAHARFQAASPDTICNCRPFDKQDLETIKSEESRRYGLARSLFNDWSKVNKVVNSLNRAFGKAGALGFDQGRVAWGIDSLTEDYLRAVEDRKDQKEIERRADDLSASLVAFAEKVLIVANNHYLLHRPEDVSEATGGKAADGKGDAKEFQYVSVLQSVGNSILTMGDELRHRQDYDGRSASRARAEARVLERTFQRDARQVIGDLLADLHTEARRLGPDAKAAKGDKQKLDRAIKAIVETEKQVLDAADASDLADNGSVALTLLRKAIARKRNAAEKANKADEKQKFSDALSVLAERGVEPGRVLESGEPKAGETQRDVMDRLIAFLRHEQIQAERRGAKAQVESLEGAIKRAYDQRGGMAYLRPAMAYLRNVYAATTLQNDPRLDAGNMLFRPSESDVNPLTGQSRKQDRLISTEIDKQFWQPVNTVQVRGGGNVNYVIAKDDVGNWYVKAYEVDPEPIIRAAQSVALFNIGQGLNANLLRRRDLQRQLDATKDTSQREQLNTQLNAGRDQGGGAASAALRKVFTRYQSAHAKATQSDYQALVTSFVLDSSQRGDVKRRILKKWDADDDLRKLPDPPNPLGSTPSDDDKKKDDRLGLRKAITDALDAEILEWPGGVEQDSSDTTIQVIAIDLALRSILKFATDLTSRLETLPFDAHSDGPPASGYYNREVAAAARDKAQSAVKDVVRAFIEDRAAGRIDSAARYGTSLQFLGEAVAEGATNN